MGWLERSIRAGNEQDGFRATAQSSARNTGVDAFASGGAASDIVPLLNFNARAEIFESHNDCYHRTFMKLIINPPKNIRHADWILVFETNPVFE